MANFLYPPIVDNFIAPITLHNKSYENDGIEINYSDPVSTKEYQYIRARIVAQSNNFNLADKTVWLDQFVYIKPNNNKITIPFKYFLPQEDKEGEQIKLDSSLIGQIIKVQLSYVYFDNWGEDKSFPPTNKEKYYEDLSQATFSEWSTALVFKFIDLNVIEDNKVIELGTAEAISLTPAFTAFYSFTEKSNEDKDKYKFQLYKDGLLLEDSDWLQYNSLEQGALTHRFKTGLIDYEEYTIKFYGYSNNNYLIEDKLKHIAYDNTLDHLPARLSTEINYEDACVDIYYEWLNDDLESGAYVIARASEKDGFTKWEDLYCFDVAGYKDKSLVYTDYTVESGITYQYCIQKEYSETGLRTARLIDTENPYICVYLSYAYLYENGLQLKLKYNNKLTSYKNTVLASKQDTLGSKYPTILRNGYAYYSEFPVNGLISLHLDDGNKFFQENSDGYYYKKQLIIPKSKYIEDPFNTNLTQTNFFIERMFRDKVEEFLNNGNYKIFRSPLIGNKVVSLMNIALTPNSTLGGLIAEFSGTAYEVMDWDFETMVKFGILNHNKNSNLLKQPIEVYGQVNVFNGESLQDQVIKILENKYSTDSNNLSIEILNIDKGYNNSISENIEPKSILSGLNYPITISYKAITLHKESYYNGANNLQMQTIKKQTTGTLKPADLGEDRLLLNYLQNIADQQFLRILSLNFFGPGEMSLEQGTNNWHNYIIPPNGLSFDRATDITNVKLIEGQVLVSYLAAQKGAIIYE